MIFLLLMFAGFAAFGQGGGDLEASGVGIGDSAGPRLAVDLVGGYQRQDLRWSIAGNSLGTSPNIYSELRWKGVGGVSTGLDISWKAWKNWVVVVGGSRAWTVGGRVSDKDYGADDRRDVLYDQSFNANKGYAYALFFGLGYELRVGSCLLLTPAAGYGVSGQRLSITDESLLNSYYRTWWKGLVFRLRGEWTLGPRWGVVFSGGYRQVNYRAEGDWNLIQTFSHPVSFRHRADGYGLEGRLGVKYKLGRAGIFLTGHYAGWTTGKGVDELYLVSGQTSQTQLNEVVLHELGVTAGVRFGW